ncbi:MAG TPA: EamA/RhaT family transporter, partial [Lachnospiraceae bacterium]|nr:EamA/RhaT family transporter [Lachnospiraceae bacterium]
MRMKSLLQMIIAMLIFGTIGIFVRSMNLPSGFVAMVRGLSGMLFMILVICLKKSRINWKSIQRNLKVLILSGTFIGANWILLFEAYRYTSVATATL